jgi:hypothetical protein
MRLPATFLLAASLLSAAACASSGKPTGYDAPGDPGSSGGLDAGTTVPLTDTIEVDPQDLVVDVSDTAPQAIEYHAKLVHPNGTSEDVTNQAQFSTTGFGADVGLFSANVFSPAPGKVGKTTIQAVANNVSGTTSLTIRRSSTILEPGAPSDAPNHFGGADDPALAPDVVYPPDGVLVPPNMNVLEVHYQPKTANLFELHVTSPVLDLKVYFTCQSVGGGCALAADQNVWSLMASAGRGADPLTYTLRGTDGAKQSGVGTSAARTIAFGEEDILGGLYYWNAGGGTTMRYEFGVSGQQAELFMGAPQAGAGVCVGCHVLSRSGKKVALGMDIPAPAAYKVFDVATRAPIFAGPNGGSNFFSFSPDESQILTSTGASITLRSATDGTPVTDPLIPSGAMPDFSPDGSTIVYAKPAQAVPFGAPGVDDASLETMTKQNGTFAPGPTLVAGGTMNNYYPAFSSDGQWVLFNRSPSSANSYDAADAEVWVVPAKGGAPIQLAKARAGGDSWPKWTPDVQKYRGKSLLWFTFSSRRAYGLRLANGTRAQIWMAALDPEAAAKGQDGSFPAFWLPFQDMGSGNHIAQWVTHVERKPCDQGGSQCDPGDTCDQGRCVPTVK